MQRILIHVKNTSFVKSGHIHPEYVANLVYYHCHWILLQPFYGYHFKIPSPESTFFNFSSNFKEFSYIGSNYTKGPIH